MASDPGTQTVEQFLADLAGKSSTPGGGSAAAISGSQGAALLCMVAAFTRQRSEAINRAHAEGENARKGFLRLAREDATAFDQVMHWYRKDRASISYQQSLKEAADVPLKTMELAASLQTSLAVLHKEGNDNLLTDVAVAAQLLLATIHAAEVNVRINLSAIDDTDFSYSAKARIEQCKLCASDYQTVFDEILTAL